MKLLVDSWNDFLSDEFEEILCGFGPHIKIPLGVIGKYLYDPFTKEVFDPYGIFVTKCETVDEFNKLFPYGKIYNGKLTYL